MISSTIIRHREKRRTMGESELAKFVRHELDALGINERQLAERAGVHPSTLNNIMNSPEVTPRLESLAQLSKALRVPLGRLVELCGFSVGVPVDVDVSAIRRALADPELTQIFDDLLRLRPEQRAAIRGYVHGMLAKPQPGDR